MPVDLDLARTYVADVYERHARHLVDLLIHALDVPKGAPVSALDLACGVGFATLEIAKVLPTRSRVVALSDDRKSLVQLHRSLPAELRPNIYPRKERAHRLPFAPGAFDLAWACLPTRTLEPIRVVIRQALRVLRPGGMLAFCAPLRGSFLELISAAGQVATGHPELSVQRLIAERPPLYDLDEWQEMLRRAGGIEVGAERATFEIVVQPPLSRDKLVAYHLLPLWLGRNAADAEVESLLDLLTEEPLPVKVHIGCVYARRGLADMSPW